MPGDPPAPPPSAGPAAVPGRRALARALAVIMLLGWVVHAAPPVARSRPAVAAPPPPATGAPGPGQGGLGGQSGRAGPAAPVHLDIPAIGVHTPLIGLGLRRDGTVAVPPPASDAPAGWHEHSAPPGAAGAAVLLGRAESARGGPAVFHRLAALRPGDLVRVRRADGSTVRFTVTIVVRHAGPAVPAGEVSRRTAYPSLRLVTCGRSVDRARRSYHSTVVVHAR